MARDEGFTIADIASDYYDDEKIRRLWRRLQDPGDMCEATTVHKATVLASWKEGKRVTVEEAVPLWLAARPEIVSALMAVGLLDRGRRVPSRSWSEWYEPARLRREARRAGGRNGGLAKAAASQAVAKPKPGSTRPAVRPVRPSVRPDKPFSPRSPASPAGGERGGPSFREALAAEGFPPPTKGGAS